VVDTDESDQRRDHFHRNLRNCGTFANTLAEATELVGTIRRKDRSMAHDHGPDTVCMTSPEGARRGSASRAAPSSPRVTAAARTVIWRVRDAGFACGVRLCVRQNEPFTKPEM